MVRICVSAMSLFQKIAAAFGIAAATPGKPKRREPKHANNRALMRKRQRMLDGFIVSEGMLTPRPCTLRDVTALGACVEIWDDSVKPALLRNRLTLYIPSDGKEVDCDVMWKRDNAIGLKFATPFRGPSRRYPG